MSEEEKNWPKLKMTDSIDDGDERTFLDELRESDTELYEQFLERVSGKSRLNGFFECHVCLCLCVCLNLGHC